jgi:hypothetical protein
MHKILSRLSLAVLLTLATANHANGQIPTYESIVQTPGVTAWEVILAPGHGTTIDFLSVKQKVSWMTLDNKSFFTADTDGCMRGLQPSCTKNEASSIHLVAIDKLKIPGSNNIGQIDRGLLTVITVDEFGVNHRYLFNIRQSDAYSSKASWIQVIPDTFANGGIATKLKQGKDVAIAQGLLVDVTTIAKTDALIREIESGLSLKQAAEKTGLTNSFVERLLVLGS